MRPHPVLLDIAAERPLGAPRDASELVSSAIEHRMQGLLWSAVIEGELALNAPARKRIAQEHARITVWQRRLQSALVRVTEQLDAVGVGATAFKGVTTSARWYERDGDRPCVDLDLLLAPADGARTGEVVQLLQPSHPLANDAQALVDAGYVQSIDLTLGDGIFVDLHTDLLKIGVPSRSAGTVWERSGPVSLRDGGIVRAIDAECALVQLLIGLTKDRFRYLIGYADVARLLAREQLDWAFIDDLVRAEGLEAPVYLALDAVTSTLGIPSPPHPAPRGWRASAWRHLWPETIRLQGDIGRLKNRNRQRWLPLLARGRAREGTAALWRFLFPAPELMDYYFPGTGGGYLRRNTLGRLRHLRERRGRERRLRARSAPRGPGAGSTREDG